MRGCFAGILISVGVVVGLKYTLPLLLRSSVQSDTQRALEAEALRLRVPTGAFGAKWLMTMKEVERIVPNAKKVANDRLAETRSVNGRTASVAYDFDDDCLIYILITFLGPSSETQFADTQKILEDQHGPMSAPAADPEHPERVLLSSVERGRVRVDHQMVTRAGTTVEQIMMYRVKSN